jgi:hypothetical protein
MSAFVVDTNGRSDASPACVNACVDALSAVLTNGTIVLDDGMRILREYMDNLSLSGEPGVGDAFMKWVWNVQADEDRCERVHLTSRGEEYDFSEFPDDPALATFDRSDRKFAAVALASALEPVILNAVDSDWAKCYLALERNGLTIHFLCPQHVSP